MPRGGALRQAQGPSARGALRFLSERSETKGPRPHQRRRTQPPQEASAVPILLRPRTPPERMPRGAPTRDSGGELPVGRKHRPENSAQRRELRPSRIPRATRRRPVPERAQRDEGSPPPPTEENTASAGSIRRSDPAERENSSRTDAGGAGPFDKLRDPAPPIAHPPRRTPRPRSAGTGAGREARTRARARRRHPIRCAPRAACPRGRRTRHPPPAPGDRNPP